ncbi:hypothetical protein B9G53_00270 [Pseudanabaena sp. SR411]|uniref:hypothetical protein n=1 Tax=Pseudanabaena sp. SR411 TaxID=1980935 RepID=UPI000B99B8A6|nr:hypothetical protein [Pseudanabaena sp. SR411]OYQ67999.1 hypothetical protein B9G53_00270 [Pseudanabaena sp. SR411]
MSNRNWASQPLNEKSDQMFLSIGDFFPISLISTNCPITCNIDDSLESILEKEQLENFDHIPVCSQEIIVGLLNKKDAKDRDFVKTVGEAMDRLDQSILISSHASILSFIEEADKHPCRLVLDGTEIKGIVTISDLQKLEVRPVLFSLITYLELLMSEFIRKDFPFEDWINKLSQRRKELVNEKWEYLNHNNMAIDRLSATDFCDKRDILMSSKLFNNNLSTDKNEAKDIFKKIEKLRNSVAHAGDYAITEDKAKEVSQTVRDMQDFIKVIKKSIRDLETNVESS